jgi:hypothetical protein
MPRRCNAFAGRLMGFRVPLRWSILLSDENFTNSGELEPLLTGRLIHVLPDARCPPIGVR